MELNTTQALIDGAQIAVLGMTVVFSALVLISLIIANFDNLEKIIKIKPYEHGHGHGHSAAAPKKEAKKSTSEQPTEVVEEGISPQVIAALSAAIAVATEKKVRITRVRYRREPAQPTWAAQGRTAIMSGRAVKQ